MHEHLESDHHQRWKQDEAPSGDFHRQHRDRDECEQRRELLPSRANRRRDFMRDVLGDFLGASGRRFRRSLIVARAYRFHGIESAASSTVPNMIPGGYHQLVTPSTSGSSPAEIAGATGERNPSTTTIAPITLSSTEKNP